ncbi:hypothetical protein HOLleu_44533 [Holothuria leucospilota]|uniref:Uncharacterized protein n=1 Tax=Holothuria leucospilota TaxID=206669 RepID=A0A9Q0Y8S2_HOLLE|nr:hypothetical protein HOLleu_44533 [Holothuria leucospilota]
MNKPTTRFPLGDECCSVKTDDVPLVVLQIIEFIFATMMGQSHLWEFKKKRVAIWSGLLNSVV